MSKIFLLRALAQSNGFDFKMLELGGILVWDQDGSFATCSTAELQTWLGY